MAVPLATTTVTVTRNQLPAAPNDDPYDSTPTVTTIATAVRATIDPPTEATVRLNGGDRVVYNSKLLCDPVLMAVGDFVADAATGLTWVVMAFQQVNGLGLNHTFANIRLTTGSV